MTNTDQQTTVDVVMVDMEELPKKWGWMLALGILLLLAGSLGLYMSVAVTIMTVLLFGALILAGGALSLIQTIVDQDETWQGRLFHVLLALFYIISGAIVLANPMAASAVLTLMLGAMFAAMGVTRLTYGFRCRKNGWKWILPIVIGLVDLIFAFILVASWPVSGLWVIGLFVSVELLMYGWILTFTAIAVRKIDRGKEKS